MVVALFEFVDLGGKVKSILILNTAPEENKELELFLRAEGYKVIINKGSSAVDAVKRERIDIVLMDLILENADGFQILEEFKSKLERKPKIIILSALSSPAFINKAMNLGVSYYMLKPFNKENLLDRIKDVCAVASTPKSESKIIEEKITNILLNIGIPACIKGYQFIKEGIRLAIETPSIVNNVTTQLYPKIAERFEANASSVERAIRHALEVAWNRGKIENLNGTFGVKVYNANEKPTNGEFIALVADKMLLDLMR